MERVARWLTLVANLGVMGGLVVLAVEVRHNSQVVRAEARTSLAVGQIAAETAFMGEDTAAAFALALEAPDQLSDRQIVQLWAYLNTAVLSVQQTHSSWLLGLATEEDLAAAVDAAAGWLSFPFGLVWWSEIKTNFPEDLATQIDEALEANPDYLARQLEGMKRGVRALGAP